MSRTSNSRLARWIVSAGLMLIVASGSTASAQPRDRTPPTHTTDLHVTAIAPYGLSLAWNPSTDKSGPVSYVVCCANVSSQTVAPGATSVVYAAGLEAGRSFS